jgi:hypothetical protein
MQTQVSETIGSTTYTLTHYFNGNDCYETVKECSERFWKSAPKTESIENYQFNTDAKSWSLGPMLEHGVFDGGYTILDFDGKPWSFGGIRKYTDEIALVLCRHFSFFTIKPTTHGFLLPFHLEIAKELGYKKAWITINDYNLHWYNTWHVREYNKVRSYKRLNKLYTNSDLCVSRCRNLGNMTIHNTEQTVLEWVL